MLTDMSFDAGARSYAIVVVLADRRRLLAGALTGLIIVGDAASRDIIVTLAMLFVWAGVALAVLQMPGGGAPLRAQLARHGRHASGRPGSRRRS